jgi:hypothetical protein
MNHRTAGFAGFYGGVVFAGRVMVGGGAYFQVDDYPSEQMAYGGLVAEYRLVHDHPVGVTLHGLAGYGATNLPIYGHHGGYNYGYSGSCGYGYAYYSGCPYDGFFIGEPEVQVAARFGDGMRLVGRFTWPRLQPRTASSAASASSSGADSSIQFVRQRRCRWLAMSARCGRSASARESVADLLSVDLHQPAEAPARACRCQRRAATRRSRCHAVHVGACGQGLLRHRGRR